jgi:hypothetical protein
MIDRNKMIAERMAEMLLNAPPAEYAAGIRSMNHIQLEHFGKVMNKLQNKQKHDRITDELKVACSIELGT